MLGSIRKYWNHREPANHLATIAAIIAILIQLAEYANAQTSVSNFVWEEFPDRISKTEKVSSLGPDLFGDNVRLANGELGFEITDISLPGNNSLRVDLSRMYEVFSRKTFQPDAMLADWQIQVPNISGSFAPDWGTGTEVGYPGRCTTNSVPADPQHFDLLDFWKGLSVSIPGEGEK